ncbi:HipA domain-containing protein [Sulfurospirillum diekertiae]|nr:HipA domain-containing protein [Sulfurospirillum diekertiae]
MSSSMNIFYNNKVIAKLTLSNNDDLDLLYTDEWKQQGFALSPFLPLHEAIDKRNVKKFILNLLPEGDGLEALSKLFHISKANPFALLHAIGNETSGALSFGTSGFIETSFREVSKEELRVRIKERKNTPITIWDGKVRLSLAGVQEKLPIAILNGKFGFAEGNLASTHILKFDTSNTHLVLNEFLSLHLAKKAGLVVTKAQINFFDHEPVLVVERFDRKILANGTEVQKLHVIDGCQLLSLAPSYKYERNFGSARDVQNIRQGASFRKLIQNETKMDIPVLFKKALLDWSLVNLCLGNSDAHGKNISFFVHKSTLTLAPFYDIVNVKLYDTYDQDLAMAIGDEFEIENVKPYDLATHCHTLNIKQQQLVLSFNTIATNIKKELENKNALTNIKEINAIFYEKYIHDVTIRMDHLQKVVEEFKRTNFSEYF